MLSPIIFSMSLFISDIKIIIFKFSISLSFHGAPELHPDISFFSLSHSSYSCSSSRCSPSCGSSSHPWWGSSPPSQLSWSYILQGNYLFHFCYLCLFFVGRNSVAWPYSPSRSSLPGHPCWTSTMLQSSILCNCLFLERMNCLLSNFSSPTLQSSASVLLLPFVQAIVYSLLQRHRNKTTFATEIFYPGLAWKSAAVFLSMVPFLVDEVCLTFIFFLSNIAFLLLTSSSACTGFYSFLSRWSSSIFRMKASAVQQWRMIFLKWMA